MGNDQNTFPFFIYDSKYFKIRIRLNIKVKQWRF